MMVDLIDRCVDMSYCERRYVGSFGCWYLGPLLLDERVRDVSTLTALCEALDWPT